MCTKCVDECPTGAIVKVNFPVKKAKPATDAAPVAPKAEPVAPKAETAASKAVDNEEKKEEQA